MYFIIRSLHTSILRGRMTLKRILKSGDGRLRSTYQSAWTTRARRSWNRPAILWRLPVFLLQINSRSCQGHQQSVPCMLDQCREGHVGRQAPPERCRPVLQYKWSPPVHTLSNTADSVVGDVGEQKKTGTGTVCAKEKTIRRGHG